MGKKTSLLTFRIDENYEKVLRKDAKDRKITLNSLANQIFGEYVEYKRFMERFGFIIISKEGFETILNALDEKEIIRVATKIGEKAPKEFILFKWKTISTENFVDFVKMYFEHCGYGKSDVDLTETKITFSIRHNLGEKGSLFLKEFLETAIKSMFTRSCESVLTGNLLTLSFRN